MIHDTEQSIRYLALTVSTKDLATRHYVAIDNAAMVTDNLVEVKWQLLRDSTISLPDKIVALPAQSDKMIHCKSRMVDCGCSYPQGRRVYSIISSSRFLLEMFIAHTGERGNAGTCEFYTPRVLCNEEYQCVCVPFLCCQAAPWPCGFDEDTIC